MRLIYLAGGRNCKTDTIPESYPALKKQFKEGRNSDWLFKLEGKLVIDLDSKEKAIERARQQCIADAPTKRRATAVRRAVS